LRVLLLAPYPLRSAPGQRFRFEQYLAPLAERGYAIDVRCLLNPQAAAVLKRPGRTAAKASIIRRGAAQRVRDLLRARGYDVVFVYRAAFPLGPALFERALARLGVPYVLDFDDAIWQTNVSEVNKRFARLKFAGKMESIARHATVVSAGNEFLADWARRVNDNVVVVPTTIDTDVYRPHPPSERDRLCVGWSGSETTAKHLAGLTGVLRDVQHRHDVRLLVIGPAHFIIENADVEVREWNEQTELEDLSQIDIGVMPLPDDPWARGKCGLKALQYMALGIPTVMSPVGVNTDIAEGGAALLASTEEQWTAVLGQLIADSAMRRRIGEAGRRRVEERYSIHRNVDRYADLLDRAASLGVRR
jgi:glycosyltransferase involved in cell wall biosynthesis